MRTVLEQYVSCSNQLNLTFLQVDHKQNIYARFITLQSGVPQGSCRLTYGAMNPPKVNDVATDLGLEFLIKAPVEETIKRVQEALSRKRLPIV